MRHLDDKLGAHRRLEAIDRARALGLLAPVPEDLTPIPAARLPGIVLPGAGQVSPSSDP